MASISERPPHPIDSQLIEIAIAARSDQQRQRGLNPSPILRYAAKGKPKAYGQEARGKKCNA